MNSETLADIVAEMRNCQLASVTKVEKYNKDQCFGCDSHPACAEVAEFADRIEAAAEREMAKGLSKELDGNRAITADAAAIHTALDSVRIEMLKRLAGIQPQISDMGILELCVDAQHNITPGEAAMADAVGKAVKSIDPHALPPFHEEYAIKTTQGYVWRGDSEEDFELLKTLDGARKIVDRLESYNLMQGFWEHPKHTIVRRVVGEWEDA